MHWRIKKLVKRYGYINYYFKGLIFNPIKTLQYFIPHILGKMPAKFYFIQIFGPKILKETLSAANEVGISPFLVFGTLLGYRRNKNIIKVDSDIDLGVFDGQTKLFAQLKNKMKELGYEIRTETALEISFIKKAYANCWIDIFTFFKRADKREVYVGVFYKDDQGQINNVCIRKHPEAMFESFEAVNFLGVKVNALSNCDDYLKLNYGEGWQIPHTKPISWREKQKTSFPNKIVVTKEQFDKGDF